MGDTRNDVGAARAAVAEEHQDPRTPAADLGQVRAELEAVIETAERVAHDGLTEGTDGPRLLAGLVAQVAGQLDRSLQLLSEGDR